jgi:hypothetical protein
MRLRRSILSVMLLISAALCSGSNCIQRSTLDQPTGPQVSTTVALRNATDRAIHLVLSTERADASNLVQPGAARTVDVNLADRTLGVLAFAPDSPLIVGAVECAISEEVGGALAPTGVEIAWTAAGPTGFECRNGL